MAGDATGAGDKGVTVCMTSITCGHNSTSDLGFPRICVGSDQRKRSSKATVLRQSVRRAISPSNDIAVALLASHRRGRPAHRGMGWARAVVRAIARVDTEMARGAVHGQSGAGERDTRETVATGAGSR